MSIKIKPIAKFVLQMQGKKKQKIELFYARDFVPKNAYCRQYDRNGKWYGQTGKGKGRTFMTKWEFRDILWRSFWR